MFNHTLDWDLPALQSGSEHGGQRFPEDKWRDLPDAQSPSERPMQLIGILDASACEWFHCKGVHPGLAEGVDSVGGKDSLANPGVCSGNKGYFCGWNFQDTWVRTSTQYRPHPRGRLSMGRVNQPPRTGNFLLPSFLDSANPDDAGTRHAPPGSPTFHVAV